MKSTWKQHLLMTIVHFVFLKKYKSINIFELKNIKIPISIIKGKKIYECVLIATELQWPLTETFRDVTEAAENINRFSSLLY